jgi:hypothetical protein
MHSGERRRGRGYDVKTPWSCLALAMDTQDRSPLSRPQWLCEKKPTTIDSVSPNCIFHLSWPFRSQDFFLLLASFQVVTALDEINNNNNNDNDNDI